MEGAASKEDDRIPQLRERYRQAFLALRDTLNGRGIPFTLAAYPFYLTISGKRTPEQINWVVQMAQAAGVPAVNLLPPLKNAGASTTSLYLLPIDGHPSPRGYAIAATDLAERLSKSRPLSSSCR